MFCKVNNDTLELVQQLKIDTIVLSSCENTLALWYAFLAFTGHEDIADIHFLFKAQLIFASKLDFYIYIYIYNINIKVFVFPVFSIYIFFCLFAFFNDKFSPSTSHSRCFPR